MKHTVRPLALRLWPTGGPPPTEEQLKQWTAEKQAGQDFQALAAVSRSGGDFLIQKAEFVKITVPTLAIVGTADPFLKDFETLKSAMPQLKLVTIPDASHSSAPLRPEFVQALQSFLDANTVQARR